MGNADHLRILHIISGLGTGGAEMMLTKLLSQVNSSTMKSEVISLTNIGPAGETIAALGVPVEALGMRRGIPNPLFMSPLARHIRKFSPNVIQTWMYHADLIGGLTARWAGRIPVLWNLRQSAMGGKGIKLSTALTMRTCARLSRRLPARIVCGSEAARAAHIKIGYAPEKMVVIPNGFDLTDYCPNHASREHVRAELGLPAGVILIGMMARFHHLKDHRTFIEAAAWLHQGFTDVHFVLCGENVTWANPELVDWIDQAGLRDHFHLLGRRADMPRINAALDVATLSSLSEGFPNAVGEAMACGVPCVVTDVGDSAIIVGDTGCVVPCRDPEAIARAWIGLMENPTQRIEMGLAARRRVQERYSLSAITARYEALYEEMGRHVRD